MARSRAENEDRETFRNMRFSMGGVTTLACLPGMIFSEVVKGGGERNRGGKSLRRFLRGAKALGLPLAG
jgi:hypothetical protein